MIERTLQKPILWWISYLDLDTKAARHFLPLYKSEAYHEPRNARAMGSSSSSVCVSFRDDADTVILLKDSKRSTRTSVKDDTAVGTLMALCIKDNKHKWVGRLGEQLVTRSEPKACNQRGFGAEVVQNAVNSASPAT